MSVTDTGIAERNEVIPDPRFVPRSYLRHHPVIAVSADGPWIRDADGNEYLDFAVGIGAVNVGHRHPLVVAALHSQVDRILHVGPVMLHEEYLRLARRISERVRLRDQPQVLFVNSGAEAVENAVKVARHATGRAAVIAFDRSFHGRTLLASTLTGKTLPYKSQPGAMAPEVYHAPYPYPYRPPYGVRNEDLVDHCLDALDAITRTRLAGQVAAVIVEIVQGEGGYIVPPPGFLPQVQDWCRGVGALLVVDEIQTGYGRTGRFLGSEHEGLTPDIVVLGKSLAAGLPLAAVVAAEDVFGRVVAGDIGGTYGGNPLACAAGNAVLDVFDSEPLLENARRIGKRATTALGALQEQYEQVGDVRGLGAMVAFELVQDRRERKPNPDLTRRILSCALGEGLVIIRTGVYDNVIRLLPPLTITDDALEDGLNRLATAVAAATKT